MLGKKKAPSHGSRSAIVTYFYLEWYGWSTGMSRFNFPKWSSCVRIDLCYTGKPTAFTIEEVPRDCQQIAHLLDTTLIGEDLSEHPCHPQGRSWHLHLSGMRESPPLNHLAFWCHNRLLYIFT